MAVLGFFILVCGGVGFFTAARVAPPPVTTPAAAPSPPAATNTPTAPAVADTGPTPAPAATPTLTAEQLAGAAGVADQLAAFARDFPAASAALQGERERSMLISNARQVVRKATQMIGSLQLGEVLPGAEVEADAVLAAAESGGDVNAPAARLASIADAARVKVEAEKRTQYEAERAAIEAKAKAASEADAATNTIGETVTIGYTSYMVSAAEWHDSMRSPIGVVQPDATFLVVTITVRNNDTKARTIPPFKLVDDQGREFEASPQSWQLENAIGALDSLNPTVSKSGVLLFDVPKQDDYQLVVSGGYWSADEAKIVLTP